MVSRVLDASVVLAVLFGEISARDGRRHFADGGVSTVNYAEILSRAAERNGSLETAKREVDRYRLRLIPFDANLATITASLRAATRSCGLSLGDRACLATAITLSVPALTADRSWAGLDLGVVVELIR